MSHLRPLRSPCQDQDLDQLCNKSVNGDLSPEDAKRLSKLLAESPDARYRFCEYFFLESALSDQIEISNQLQRKSIKKYQCLKSPLLIAAVIFLAAMIISTVFPLFSEKQTENSLKGDTVHYLKTLDPEIHTFGVAKIEEMINVEWFEEAAPAKINGLLVPQVLEIKSGLLQLKFTSDTTVVVEGPAELELVAPKLCIINHGKFRAHVPKGGEGFRVLTQKIEVIDLGTEFAIEAKPDGASEVHVIDGEVAFRQIEHKPKFMRTLHAGNALSVDPTGNVATILLHIQKFKGKKEVVQIASRLKVQRQHEVNEIRERVRTDEDTVVYYSPKNTVGDTDILTNSVPYAAKGSHARLLGCSFVDDSKNGEKVIHFDSPEDRVITNVEGGFPSLTLCGWLKFDSFDTDTIGLLTPKFEYKSGIRWTLRNHEQNKEYFQLGFIEQHLTENGMVSEGYFSFHNLHSPSLRNNWAHLALVYDSERNTVSQFLNGKLFSRHVVANSLDLKIGESEIGNWSFSEWARDTSWEFQNFAGSMSDFFISKRAYTDEEIRQLAKISKP